MKQYLDLLQDILDNGVEKESGRENMPNTIGLSNAIIKMDMADGFPLLTTKKMYWKGIIHELLWFLKGDTNIKYLIDNNVNIWNQDAYRWYLTECAKHRNFTPVLFDDFITLIKDGNLETDAPYYKRGDLGKVYGYQWRNQNGVDQIKECLEGLKTNPYSRYHIIDAWNKTNFKDMALPPCHLLYQFIVKPLTISERKDLCFDKDCEEEHFPNENNNEVNKTLDEWNVPKFYLDLNMYQRSCDMFLGVPFNLASMSLLLHIFAKATNMIPGVATWIGGDVHLYKNHIETGVITEQLSRTPTELPQLKITKNIVSIEDIEKLDIRDFELVHYIHQSEIKAELFTGLKK